MNFKIKDLNFRQKEAHALLESAREEYEAKELCEGCQTSGYVYVDYKGNFEEYKAFLNDIADEMEKSAKLIKEHALNQTEEALKDDALRYNLDIVLKMKGKGAKE